jgi:rRNA-processing protein FCF1
VICLSGLIIDACGWAALVDARLNLDVAMAPIIGSPKLLVLDSVARELERLSNKRSGLLLDLLEQRSERMPDIEGMKHTDDMLVKVSVDSGWPVLTVDKRLKERLVSAGGSYIEVTSGYSLRLVD